MESKNNVPATAGTASTEIDKFTSEEKIATFSKCIYHLNQVRKYPMTDDQMETWAKTLLRLRPHLTTSKLMFSIDRIIEGELDWNQETGLQNIFRAIDAPVGYSPNSAND